MYVLYRHPASVPVALAIVASLALPGCGSMDEKPPAAEHLVDPNATAETRALFENLRALAADHVLFGHQDALAYGIGWSGDPGRSDVKDVAGSHPAVYGWDVGDLEHGASRNLDGVNFGLMREWIREGYGRGGVITVSWHMDNPASGGDAWDTTPGASSILPGGEHHGKYRTWLDRFANWVPTEVPIIFRPFHEHTGNWFWWGRESATAEEYRHLWQFTVEYLRDVKGLRNLLYCYAPDIVDSPAQYLERYPGDDYVDVLAYDDYWALNSDAGAAVMAGRLRMLVTMAEERGKLAALAETGLDGIGDEDWWTNRLLRAIKSDPVGRRIAWVLVWRNARTDHHFAPYPGHRSAEDFVAFHDDPFTLFEDDLPDLYQPLSR